MGQTSGHFARTSGQLRRNFGYFGEDVMKISTVSSLPNEKLKEIKARLYEDYRFNNQVEFEPLWQKCQALRAKDGN